jgi:hypothetical protein
MVAKVFWFTNNEKGKQIVLPTDVFQPEQTVIVPFTYYPKNNRCREISTSCFPCPIILRKRCRKHNLLNTNTYNVEIFLTVLRFFNIINQEQVF